MVTHYPSSNGSSSSLPLSSSSTSSFRPTYASSQAGSSTVSRSRDRSSQSSSRSWREREQNRHHRSPSVGSTSSQNTLVPSHRQAPQSIAGYPTAPPSAYSNYSSRSGQRAPSVASTSAARHSSSHRHRTSSRSQATEQERIPSRAVVTNEFPWFGQSGDVEIEIKDRRGNFSKRYLLHRLILAQNSTWFENDLAGDNPIDDSTSQRVLPGASTVALLDGQVGKRRYELDWTRCRDQNNGLPLLHKARSLSTHQRADRPPVTTRNKPSPPTNSFFRSLASTWSNDAAPLPQQPSDDEEVLVAYDNLFLIFYNHSPRLSTSNIATAYVESKLLLSLAASYSALTVAGPRVDHHLLRFGSRLWKQIAKYPPSYLKLGYLARSRAIFSEALTHVVGQWPMGSAQLQRGAVDDVVVDLVEDKVDELEDLKLRVESKLLRINLTMPRGERVNPYNSYVDWLALSLFRQWISDQVVSAAASTERVPGASSSPNPQPRLQTPSRLAKAYRLIGQGGQAYLTHDEIKKFLKLGSGGYSRENMRKCERRMEELKHLAREAVKPLARSWLELDTTGTEASAGGASSVASYLTCVRCEERDFTFVWKD